MTAWPNAIRILDLAGGARALNNPGPKVTVFPTVKGEAAEYEIKTYGELIQSIRRAGLAVVGNEFIDDPDEIAGLRESDWRAVYDPMGDARWPSDDIQQLWSQIGHAAGGLDRMSIFEKAGHIAIQLRVCTKRLQDFCYRHHRHLVALCRAGDFKPGHRMDGRFSDDIFISAHAAFGELASLRDHLAIFVAREILGISNANVDSMVKLVDHRDFKSSVHPVADAIRAAGNWLSLFADYRNLIVHNAPLAAVNGRIAILQFEQPTRNGVPLAGVSLLLPPNPGQLRAALRSNSGPSSFKAWVEIVREATPNGPDALTYVHEVLGHFLRLAKLIGEHSPVPPQMVHITDADVIGEIKIERRVIPPLKI